MEGRRVVQWGSSFLVFCLGGTKLTKVALICLLHFHLGGKRELLRYELDQLGLVEQDCLRETVASILPRTTAHLMKRCSTILISEDGGRSIKICTSDSAPILCGFDLNLKP